MNTIEETQDFTSSRPTGDELIIQRLRNRLLKKNKKISALRKELAELKKKPAPSPIGDVDKKIAQAVKHTLSNMRFIPVLGMRSEDKVIDVTITSAKTPD